MWLCEKSRTNILSSFMYFYSQNNKSTWMCQKYSFYFKFDNLLKYVFLQASSLDWSNIAGLVLFDLKGLFKKHKFNWFIPSLINLLLFFIHSTRITPYRCNICTRQTGLVTLTQVNKLLSKCSCRFCWSQCCVLEICLVFLCFSFIFLFWLSFFHFLSLSLAF